MMIVVRVATVKYLRTAPWMKNPEKIYRYQLALLDPKKRIWIVWTQRAGLTTSTTKVKKYCPLNMGDMTKDNKKTKIFLTLLLTNIVPML